MPCMFVKIPGKFQRDQISSACPDGRLSIIPDYYAGGAVIMSLLILLQAYCGKSLSALRIIKYIHI